MKLIGYAEALKMGKKAVSDMLIPVKVKRARKQAELEMCKLEEKIATKESNIQEMCCSDDVCFSSLIDQQDDLAIMERRKAQYQKILDEMFPSAD